MAPSRLVEYLEDRAGEYHRGTVSYTGDSQEVLHLRDDIEGYRLEREIAGMIDRLRSEAAREETDAFPFGDLHATVRTFDDATILHFPTGEDRGIVVSLEPGTARDLNTFIGECERRLRASAD